MQPFKYKPPRVNTGDLRTLVTFFKFQPNDGPLPGESKKETLYKSWAKVDRVWLKDLELAKANGTLSDVTITIRDPQAEYIPTNLHYLEIDAKEYENITYNIKTVQPNLQDRRFIDIIAEIKRL